MMCAYTGAMKRTNTFLPETMRTRLQKQAKKTGLSVSELIRRAIDAFLKEPK